MPQDGPDNPGQFVGQGHHHSVGMRPCQQATQPCAVALLARKGMAARAPWISSLRRYLLPRLLIPSRRGFPPVVAWRGTSPNQAARSRPRAKVLPLPIAVTSAVAFSTPGQSAPRPRSPCRMPQSAGRAPATPPAGPGASCAFVEPHPSIPARRAWRQDAVPACAGLDRNPAFQQHSA